jgi:hypothetical protein
VRVARPPFLTTRATVPFEVSLRCSPTVPAKARHSGYHCVQAMPMRSVAESGTDHLPTHAGHPEFALGGAESLCFRCAI